MKLFVFFFVRPAALFISKREDFENLALFIFRSFTSIGRNSPSTGARERKRVHVDYVARMNGIRDR